jgi:hypothetical protein
VTGARQTIAVIITLENVIKIVRPAPIGQVRKRTIGFELWIIYRRVSEDIKYERTRYK